MTFLFQLYLVFIEVRSNITFKTFDLCIKKARPKAKKIEIETDISYNSVPTCLNKIVHKIKYLKSNRK